MHTAGLATVVESHVEQVVDDAAAVQDAHQLVPRRLRRQQVRVPQWCGRALPWRDEVRPRLPSVKITCSLCPGLEQPASAAARALPGARLVSEPNPERECAGHTL